MASGNIMAKMWRNNVMSIMSIINVISANGVMSSIMAVMA
jgi:hypothetical protein